MLWIDSKGTDNTAIFKLGKVTIPIYKYLKMGHWEHHLDLQYQMS